MEPAEGAYFASLSEGDYSGTETSDSVDWDALDASEEEEDYYSDEEEVKVSKFQQTLMACCGSNVSLACTVYRSKRLYLGIGFFDNNRQNSYVCYSEGKKTKFVLIISLLGMRLARG